MSRTTGIETRHARACAAHNGGDCNCHPTFQANVWSARDKKRIRKTFSTPTAAKRWRADAQGELRRGTMRAPSSTTLRQAAAAWLEGAKSGAVRTRSGDVYKASTVRGYEQGLADHVLPELGAVKLSDVRRADVQDLADRMLAAGLDPSTIRNALAGLRTIYRRALARGEVAVNPTSGLELPAVRGRRERIAAPDEAARLLAALPQNDRALWATALFAGLRRGELMALRLEDVDLAAGVLRVERSYDPKARTFVTPNSRAGTRAVPIAAVLREHLIEHKLRSGRSEGLVFGRNAEEPFTSSNVWRRARTAWRRTHDRGCPAASRRERAAPARSALSQSASTRRGTRSPR
jgi:integrase